VRSEVMLQREVPDTADLLSVVMLHQEEQMSYAPEMRDETLNQDPHLATHHARHRTTSVTCT
jgi:hypothetical protein